MKTKYLFIFLFFTISIIINSAIIFITEKNNITNLLILLLILFINIGVAYRTTEMILSLYVDKMDLPRLKKLNAYPAVAILYVTYNDVLPNMLSTLKRQTYPKYDIFILDDSTDDACKGIIDKSGFTIVRRDGRKGYKAGALNNWLSIYGNMYKYFIISDSDSYFRPDFIENMVMYAEHKANEDIAVFQSRIIN